jgi:hypothetical protein
MHSSRPTNLVQKSNIKPKIHSEIPTEAKKTQTKTYKELANVRSSLGTLAEGLRLLVCQTINFSVTLLHNNQVEDREIRTNNATADGLALAFTAFTLAIARSALLQQQANTLVGDDTLLHRETLLIVTAGNTENVALVIRTEAVTADFARHLLLVEPTAEHKR